MLYRIVSPHNCLSSRGCANRCVFFVDSRPMFLSDTAQYHQTFISTCGPALAPYRTARDHLTVAVSSLVVNLEIAACRIGVRLDKAPNCICFIECYSCVRLAVTVGSVNPCSPTVKCVVSLGPSTRPRSRVSASFLGMSGLVCPMGKAGVPLARGVGVPLMSQAIVPVVIITAVQLIKASPIYLPIQPSSSFACHA